MAHDTSKSTGMAMGLSKVINLSAGGVKIGKIEPLFNDDNENIKLSIYENFYMVLVLNSKTLVTLKAKFERYEKADNGESQYCFQFKDQKAKDIDTISKFIIVEQVNQKRLEREIKDSYKNAIKNKLR